MTIIYRPYDEQEFNKKVTIYVHKHKCTIILIDSGNFF